MRVPDLIIKKRDGGRLSRDEIFFLVNDYSRGKIPDYQISAFLMAALLRGLDPEETFWLTEAMLYSGKSIEFPKKIHPVYDKHSTGGVGDKISLTLSPLLASVGYNIAMLSGRGLGHTGGTLDKLGSIPGLNPFWTKQQIISRLFRCGLAISGQTRDIAPADRKIYALRDLTGTVESIPLITASILSKKLALKTDGIVFDIKAGSGAFMKTPHDGKRLAQSLLAICRKFKRPASFVLTDMSEPIGHNIGNFLEIMETVSFLKTGEPADIREITFRLAYEIARFSDSKISRLKFYSRLDESIRSGLALARFEDFVRLSGGDTQILSQPERYFRPIARGSIKAPSSGYLKILDAELIGRAALVLGAGRSRIEDKIDPMAGIILNKKTGGYVEEGETLFKLYGSSKVKIGGAAAILAKSFTIAAEKVASPRKIISLMKT